MKLQLKKCPGMLWKVNTMYIHLYYLNYELILVIKQDIKQVKCTVIITLTADTLSLCLAIITDYRTAASDT